MSEGYQVLGMVAQLGNDPSALEQQQLEKLALDHMDMYHQQFSQQQTALAHQQLPLDKRITEAQTSQCDPTQQLALEQEQQQLT